MTTPSATMSSRRRSLSASLSNLLSSKQASAASDHLKDKPPLRRDTFTSISESHTSGLSKDSPPPPRYRVGQRSASRPMSMLQPYNPPTMEVSKDEIPELQPIFNIMNNHSQRLYNEGYFLKLADLTPDGKPGHDRTWRECFGQLRGTVLSLWDAAELDAAGPNEEVVPTFLNLTDASIKMIDKLPTRTPGVPPLTNVLSISTAGRNRFLFHCNSHHSLAQWTAAIRLCMFEQSKLQEIYTGALIAAKGRELNGISAITDRTRFKHEDWVRVRFGAGMPWRKCWAVITQPDEKARKKAKAAAKKATKSAYTQIPVFKGDIKFYDKKRKDKKQQPIATVVDAYAAYALYPQARQLIDSSSLIKVEGNVRINADPPTESEGFVFIMPDIHPMVSGFETMLRFLFPTWDTFALYGRPGMLIPDKTDPRSLMFAMPRDGSRDCGYLDVADVVTLVVTEGQKIKLESEWREKIKVITHQKIKAIAAGNARPRSSLPAAGKLGGIIFENGAFPSSTSLPAHGDYPPQDVPMHSPKRQGPGGPRPVSDISGYANYNPQQGPPPNFHQVRQQQMYGNQPSPSRSSEASSDDGAFHPGAHQLQQQTQHPDIEPVPVTPVSQHAPSSRPLPRAGGPQGPREDNMFAGVVPPRRNGNQASDLRQQPYAGQQVPYQLLQDHPDYNNHITPPPGFALQSSHVMLRGQQDEKNDYNNHANHPANGHGTDAYGVTGAPPGRRSHPDDVHEMPGDRPPSSRQNQQQYPNQHPLPSPSSHAKVPGSAAGGIAGRVPSVNTKIERKPVPKSPIITDSPSSYGGDWIDEQALGNVGMRRTATMERKPTDEDTLDRKAVERIRRTLAGGGDSDSEYDDDEPDYASVESDPVPAVNRNAEQPRAGRMKVVGQQPEQDVVIGDAHYRPNSRGNQLSQTNIPKVDFGTTTNHSRSLSTEKLQTEIKHVRQGSGGTALHVEQDPYPVSYQGTMVGGDYRRNSTHSASGLAAQRAPSRGSITPGSEGGDNIKRRSMHWTPGMAQVGGASNEGATADFYVSAKAEAARDTTRQRYIHHRKSSSQMLGSGNHSPQRNASNEHLPQRPHSRGGMSAFNPNGLVSSPDLNARLSAKEQEVVARATGTPLIQMGAGDRKPPPHKAGLIGEVQSREHSRQRVDEAWQRGHEVANPAVQQEIARRQQQNAMKTPSPRPLSQHLEQQQRGYFPPQPPQHQVYYQPQQQQQQQYPQHQQQQSYYQPQQQQQQSYYQPPPIPGPPQPPQHLYHGQQQQGYGQPPPPPQHQQQQQHMHYQGASQYRR